MLSYPRLFISPLVPMAQNGHPDMDMDTDTYPCWKLLADSVVTNLVRGLRANTSTTLTSLPESKPPQVSGN